MELAEVIRVSVVAESLHVTHHDMTEMMVDTNDRVEMRTLTQARSE